MKKIAIILILLLTITSPTAMASLYRGTAFSVMYHKISDTEKSDAFTVTPKTFEEDVIYLKNQGFTFCTASEFDRKIKRGETNLVAITFDDGYSSDIEKALPILEKHQAKATFFVIGELIGTNGYMTEAQIKTLSESEYAEIANHTYAVHNMDQEKVRALYRGADAGVIKNDFLENKKLLERITNKPVTAASYPWGIYGKYVDSLLKKNLIITTFSSDEKPVSDTALPYGRYNRPADTTIEQIISRATARNYSRPNRLFQMR